MNDDLKNMEEVFHFLNYSKHPVLYKINQANVVLRLRVELAGKLAKIL